MKQKVNPIIVVVAAVALVGLLVFMYRYFLPPLPPRDIDNPNGMPGYAKMAKDYLKNRKPGDPPPGGMPGGSTPQQPGNTTPGP
jgi:hypothetical protein